MDRDGAVAVRAADGNRSFAHQIAHTSVRDRELAIAVGATHDERAAIGSIHPGRVDVIGGGALITQVLAAKFAAAAGITNSGDDLRDGWYRNQPKLSPDAVHLETPAAIVGVRGTTLAIRAGA